MKKKIDYTNVDKFVKKNPGKSSWTRFEIVHPNDAKNMRNPSYYVRRKRILESLGIRSQVVKRNMKKKSLFTIGSDNDVINKLAPRANALKKSAVEEIVKIISKHPELGTAAISKKMKVKVKIAFVQYFKDKYNKMFEGQSQHKQNQVKQKKTERIQRKRNLLYSTVYQYEINGQKPEIIKARKEGIRDFIEVLNEQRHGPYELLEITDPHILEVRAHAK